MAAEIERLRAENAELRKQAADAKTAIAEPEIDRASLSATAQRRLDAAIRQHKHNLENAFQRCLRDGIKKHINEVLLPMYGRKIDMAEKIISRTPPFSNKEFLTILRALHSDSTNETLRNEAFSLVKDREGMLRAPPPPPPHKFPKTAADLMKAFASHGKR